MTIQLRSAIFIAGVHQAVGTSLTLDDAMEADLVNRGCAVYTSKTSAPGEGLVPALYTTDNNGKDTLVGSNNQKYLLTPLALSIGTPGAQGFGVGICPTLPPGFSTLAGTTDHASANYGNYQYSDRSVMVWIPAFYMRIGSTSSPRYATYGANAIDILPDSAYTSETIAASHGYYRHRAFVNAGANQPGVFVDKYQCSNNAGTASSIALGMPLTSAAATGNSPFSGLTGAPTDAYYGAIVAAKTRGSRFFVTSMYIYDAISRLATAHAQAATSTTYCAWHDTAGVTSYPKGNNNSALKDVDDTSVTYTASGASGTPLLALTGSGTPFAKTTHNGQACGVADINGNVWEIAIGMSSIAATKTITGVGLANPLTLTISSHGYTTGNLGMITSVGGTTQINNKIYKLTVVDANTISLDGCNGTAFSAFTSGGSCTVGTFYTLKTAADIAAVTSGTTLATDHWGATGIAALFDAVTPEFATTHNSNGFSQKYGNAASAVFALDTAANRALSMLGFPAAGGISASGSNLFGGDFFYQHILNQICLRSGGAWDNGANAGVLACYLGTNRGSSSNSVGFRAASYL